MPTKKDKKKSKIINVKGSTSKKQEKKSKKASLSQSLVVNVNLGKGKGKKSSNPVPKTTSIPQVIYQPQQQPQQFQSQFPTTTDYIALGNKLNTLYSIEKPEEKYTIKSFSERTYPEDSIIPIDMNRTYDYYYKSKGDVSETGDDNYPFAEAGYVLGTGDNIPNVPKRRGRKPVAKTPSQLINERLDKNARQREAYAKKKEQKKEQKENAMMGQEDVNVVPVIPLNPVPIIIKKKKPKLILEEDFAESDLANN